MLGGLFISHAGVDTAQIREKIIDPVVFQRLPGDGYFMHSRGSGGAESYRRLVQAALHWCDKFIVAVSRNAVRNEWVQAEVEWALEHRRPILVARLDELGWSALMGTIDPTDQLRPVEQPQEFDFTADDTLTQERFGEALDKLLVRFPRRDPGRLR